MKKISIMLILLSCGIFLAVGTVTAATTSISPTSNLLTAGGILDQLYGLGNLQRVDDDSGQEQIWFPANGEATAQAKYAYYSQHFGYIPDLNNNGLIGDDPFMSLFNVTDNGILTNGPTATLNSGNVSFLWALQPEWGPMWTSLESQNSDGLDHMVTWIITGNDGKPDNPIGSRVIAWEDLPANNPEFDYDYNDLVVEVTVAPVPIPGAILLLGSGLLGLAGIRKKFKR